MSEEIILTGKKTKMEIDKRTRERFVVVKTFMRAKTHDECLNRLMSDYLDDREDAFKRFLVNPDLRGYE